MINFVKGLIYFYLISILSKIMTSSMYIYRVFPEVMYLFWFLYISCGFTMKWQVEKLKLFVSVSAPLLINGILFLYAYLLSGGFPNRIAESDLFYWNGLHYLNLNILLAPVMMTPLTYYFRYAAMIVLPSVLMGLGMYLSHISKERLREKINDLPFGKRER